MSSSSLFRPTMLNPILLSGLQRCEKSQVTLLMLEFPGRMSPGGGRGTASQVWTVDSGSSRRGAATDIERELGWGTQAGLPLMAGEGPGRLFGKLLSGKQTSACSQKSLGTKATSHVHI